MKIKKNLGLIIRLLFVFSLPFFTLVFCNSIYFENRFIGVNVILTFFCGLFLQYKFLKNIDINKIEKNNLIMSIFLSLYVMKVFSVYALKNVEFFKIILGKLHIYFSDITTYNLISLLALPSMIVIVYYGIKYVKKLLCYLNIRTSKFDKRYLTILFIVGTILTIIFFKYTNCMFFPKYNGNYYYDAVYTTDTAYLNLDNTYLNIAMPENDIRQPLFGVFAFPFAIVAKFLSEFIYFIPNSYVVTINIMQIALLGVINIMLAKMLNLDNKKKLLFYILFSCSFAYMLFSFVMEQYIFALFYLILAIYLGYFRYYEINYIYIGAVGSLLTSGIIIPVISKFKDFKSWFINCFKCFIAFLLILIVSGQFTQVFGAINKIFGLTNNFASNVGIVNKIQQFTYFVQSIFIGNKGFVSFIDGSPFYRSEIVDSFSIIGLIILVLCIVSAVLNRKNKIANISFLWIIFSFILLAVIGWGTSENGLILYSLYFAWAYFILIYLLIDKIIKNNKIRYLIFIILFIIMFYYSSQEFINILKFGLKYYTEKVIL